MEFIEVVIKVMTMVEVYIGLKRTGNVLLEIFEQELMLTGEVDKGLRPVNILPITQVSGVYCRVSNFLLVLLTIFHEDEKLGYSGHGEEMGDMSGDDFDTR